MIEKSLEAITKADIDALITDETREGRTIEYKRELPDNSEKGKFGLIKQITSFANAAGGDLIYGIEADSGIPKIANGLKCNIDNEILRIEGYIRNNIEPRILGLHIKPIDGFPDGPIIVIRIPKSWAAPHMIGPKDSSRFYTRTSAGKQPMDVTEIRSSFLLSETLTDRIKRFREERVARIIAQETPVPLKSSSTLILHILPVSSFSTEENYEIADVKNDARRLPPIGGGGYDYRINLDGNLNYSGDGVDTPSATYCQFFRSGRIETVMSDLVRVQSGIKYISSETFEKLTTQAVFDYSPVMKKIGFSCPLLLFLSMTGVSGANMYVYPPSFQRGTAPINMDTLLLPEIMVENYSQITGNKAISETLRPVFDIVWNACGYERSINFDANGNWNLSPRV